MRPVHLLIPHASTPDPLCRQVLGDLALPHLAALLGRLSPAWRDEADEYHLSPAHERALARAWGWSGPDGGLPFAARAAAAAGIDTADLAWGEITPLHWHAGREHITVWPPSMLDLAEDESRALFEAARPLFEDEGWALVWHAPQRWFVAHELLAELHIASLDRVVGRNPDLWMPDQPEARRLRRLQAEVQMLWYTHPVNDAREAAGRPPANSFWLSGCGVFQPTTPAGEEPVMLDTLREPIYTEDWLAWAEAWRALDAGPLQRALAHAQAGGELSLTLCGERHAAQWRSGPRTLAQRLRGWLRPPDTAALLESL